MIEMMTPKQLYTRYMQEYGKFQHKDAYQACKIDKNTFQRLRASEFENIKLKDAVKIYEFLNTMKGK